MLKRISNRAILFLSSLKEFSLQKIKKKEDIVTRINNETVSVIAFDSFALTLLSLQPARLPNSFEHLLAAVYLSLRADGGAGRRPTNLFQII